MALQKGTKIRIGEVNGVFKQAGGGIQIDLKGQRVGTFKELGKIIEWSY